MEEYRARGIVRRAAARGDANSVFRNVLLTLKEDAVAWKEFHSSLQEVFHDVEVDIGFDHDTGEHINGWVKRAGLTLPIDSSGTGVLQAIQALSYIGVYKPRLLILDEPDSHLHPDNQRKLARLLAVRPRCKIFRFACPPTLVTLWTSLGAWKQAFTGLVMANVVMKN